MNYQEYKDIITKTLNNSNNSGKDNRWLLSQLKDNLSLSIRAEYRIKKGKNLSSYYYYDVRLLNEL